MTERMDSGSWIYQREQIETRKGIAAESMLGSPPGPHTLHAYLSRLPEGEHRGIQTGHGDDPSQISSWILLKGRVLVDLPPAMGTKSLIVDEGNVIHFREHGPIQVKALQSATIVHICPQSSLWLPAAVIALTLGLLAKGGRKFPLVPLARRPSHLTTPQ
jgi:hypothetical protein